MKKKTILQKPDYKITDQIVRLTAYTKKGKSITATFDLDDLDKVQLIDTWYAQWDKTFNDYIIKSKTAKKTNGKLQLEKLTLPTFILGVSPNAPVHHLNGNILDNRKSNLEIYERSQKNEYQLLENKEIAIQLKNRYGHVVAKALISNEDLERVINQGFTWIQQKLPNGQPQVIANTEKGRLTLDHYLTDCPEDSYVYHINKNPLDNRRQNLEVKKKETSVIADHSK